MASAVLIPLAGLGLLAGCGSDRAERGAVPALVSLDTVPHGATVGTAAAGALDLPRASAPAQAGRSSRMFEVSVEVLSSEGTTLTAPRVTLFEDQAANVSVANQTSFVQTFEVERTHGAWVSDPIVGVIQDGLLIEYVVRSAPSDDGKIDVAYRLTATDLQHPIPLRSVAFQKGAPGGTIQIPKLIVEEVAGALRLTPGEKRWFATTSVGRRGRGSITVRAAENIDPPDDVLDFGDDEDVAELRALLDALAVRSGRANTLEVGAWTARQHLVPGTPIHWDERQFGDMQALAASRLVDVPGSHARVVLMESYVGGYEPGKVSPDARSDAAGLPNVFQPVVATLESGYTARVTADGALEVVWLVSPNWVPYTTRFSGDGPAVTLEVPVVHTHAAGAPLNSRRFLLPMANLANGGTAVVSIRHEPDVRQ